MSLYWGIIPHLIELKEDNTLLDDRDVINNLLRNKLLKGGDTVVITYGDGSSFSETSINSIRVEVIK